MYTCHGYGSPSGKPSRPNGKFNLDIDNPDDADRLMKAIARGEALTSPSKDELPHKYQPVFKHPLPVSDHSALHGANLRRVTCCALNRQASAAVTCGDAWALEEVYMNGAPIGLKDKSGFTPIHIAVQLDSFECVAVLLRMGADPNVTTLSGITPLFLAKSPEVQGILTEAGGLRAVINENEKPPMDFVENQNSTSLLDFIDNRAGVPKRHLFN